MATVGKYGKIEFSSSDIKFIQDNFLTMTNQNLADALGLKKTIVRNKAYELGLKKIELEPWSEEAILFLKENYFKIGDIELAIIFNEKFPKKKKWTKHHIQKKMNYLNLVRTKQEWFMIKERNRDNGSFGKRNPKNISEPPKSFFYLNAKTRIEVKPGQSIVKLKEKYNLNKK